LLIVAIVLLPVILAAGAVIANRVPLFVQPGPINRLALYLGNNVMETSAEPRLPELTPVVLNMNRDQALTKVSAAINKLGWMLDEVDGERYTVHAVATTPLLRFKDDIDVRFESTDGKTSTLHIRSASRLGKGDFGANLRHIMDLQTALNAQAEH